MTPKHLCILFLAFVAVGVAGQSEDIPIENDNQFPPENPSASEPELVIEGSGDEAVEEPPVAGAPIETTTTPQLEEVQPTVLSAEVAAPAEDQWCPTPCVCSYSGEDFTVDCSGYGLTEFPSQIHLNTTTLKLKNNKLTEIPKDVSALKKLKILNAENNSIMDLALGSVSELPELTVLKLGQNRLIEYPKDLKNSLVLTKLQELDLGGNDMRTELKLETFSNLNALKKLTLAVSTPELNQDLCNLLQPTLETVCTESCDKKMFECSEAEAKIDDDLFDATLPGTIAFEGEEDSDPIIKSDGLNNAATEDTPLESGNEKDKLSGIDTSIQPKLNENNIAFTSGRSSIVAQPEDTQSRINIVNDSDLDTQTKSDSDVKVGAATTDTKSGGIDKSVIGFIVAGMVVIVAGVVIKKNWNSIKKRFSSTPRPAERGDANANGTSPEEVPLQDKDKSPV